MGIFRLTGGELKKIFLKPGIFIVTALLVVALTLSALLFKPTTRSDSQILSISGTNIRQMCDGSYASQSPNETKSKNYIDKTYIEPSTTIIDFYLSQLENNSVSKKQELLDGIKDIKNTFNNYHDYAITDTPSTETGATNKRELLKSKIEDFQSLYSNYINGMNGFYYLLLDSQNKNELDVFLTKCLSTPFGSNTPHYETVRIIEQELDMFNTLSSYVNKIEVFSPSEEALKTAQTNFNNAKTKIDEINNEIESFVDEHYNEEDVDLKREFRTLVTRYKQAAENAYNLTQRTIESSALENFSDDYIQSLYQFENAKYKTKYTIKEQESICKFYLDNNQYAFEYANPLSLSTTSNSEANVYDFMFFALELCSFIIIIYIVFLGATMIAGEYSNGTMKLLAIRPFSRRKILFGKLLATLLVGMIFLGMTFAVTFIVGAILYSTNSLPLLLIFNAEAVGSVTPIVSILILFLCKIIEMAFYAIFALSISTWFKSNSGSVVVSLLLYFISFFLTMFTPSLGIVKYLPFVNTNLFGYFGSHIVQTSSSNLFATLFSRVIANDMSFFISFAIIAIFSIALYTITSEIFARRDIK